MFTKYKDCTLQQKIGIWLMAIGAVSIGVIEAIGVTARVLEMFDL